MKRLLLILFIALLLPLSCFAQEEETPAVEIQTPLPPGFDFESSSGHYKAIFPVPPAAEETSEKRMSPSRVYYHSQVKAVYTNPENGNTVRYRIKMEPLKENVDAQRRINKMARDYGAYFEDNQSAEDLLIEIKSEKGRWGKTIVFNFNAENPITKQPETWHGMTYIFNKGQSIYTVEALGSEAYIYGPNTDRFFDSLEILRMN